LSAGLWWGASNDGMRRPARSRPAAVGSATDDAGLRAPSFNRAAIRPGVRIRQSGSPKDRPPRRGLIASSFTIRALTFRATPPRSKIAAGLSPAGPGSRLVPALIGPGERGLSWRRFGGGHVGRGMVAKNAVRSRDPPIAGLYVDQHPPKHDSRGAATQKTFAKGRISPDSCARKSHDDCFFFIERTGGGLPLAADTIRWGRGDRPSRVGPGISTAVACAARKKIIRQQVLRELATRHGIPPIFRRKSSHSRARARSSGTPSPPIFPLRRQGLI